MQGNPTSGDETGADGFRALLAAQDVPPAANGVLIVDLAALTRNYRKLRQHAAPAECAGVVKADAYGLGVHEVAPALLAQGCQTFFVATFAEAETLRALLPDVTIYVLNGLSPGTAAGFAQAGLRPVLGSRPEIAEWNALCRANTAPLPAAIHIDTGMTRLGLRPDDCQAIGSGGDAIAFPVSLVMSHLACADDPGHPKNAAQCAAFYELSACIPAETMSLANSAGIFLGPDFHCDLVRPGIGLYGGNPFACQPNPMEPVAHLYGRIAALGVAEAGETVGYGATRTLTRRTRYVTVSTGYADGYFRALGSRDGQEGACAYIGAHRLPILGRVSMDLIVFDATDVPEDRLTHGEFIALIGSRFTVDDVANCAGTISYEVLTSLGPRYHRIYTGRSGN